MHHLILAVAGYERLRDLDYDYERLRSIMLAADLTTLQLIWREAPDRFRARDPFPVGDVVEDPATGAAAAALGAYLRWRGEIRPPARFTIRQGVEMGRPSLIEVEVPDATGGIRVSGTAVSLERTHEQTDPASTCDAARPHDSAQRGVTARIATTGTRHLVVAADQP